MGALEILFIIIITHNAAINLGDVFYAYLIFGGTGGLGSNILIVTPGNHSSSLQSTPWQYSPCPISNICPIQLHFIATVMMPMLWQRILSNSQWVIYHYFPAHTSGALWPRTVHNNTIKIIFQPCTSILTCPMICSSIIRECPLRIPNSK